MDTQLIALHQAVNDLLRAGQAVKAAGRALCRVRRSGWLSRWDEHILTDPLEDRLSAAQARQLAAEAQVLARWKDFTQEYSTYYAPSYATPALAA